MARLITNPHKELGWTGPVVWANLDASQRQAVMDLIAVWLRQIAVQEARSLTVGSATVTAKASAETAYDAAMSDIL